jgi:hypothetical protein
MSQKMNNPNHVIEHNVKNFSDITDYITDNQTKQTEEKIMFKC